MTREALANAFDKAAEAFAELAHELRANEPSVARADVAASVPTGAPVAAGVAPSAPAARPVDINACPKHGVAWEQGNFGPYCKQMTDDPAWGKAKTDRDGNPVLWCKLTPKNAPDWVRVHGLPS
jgi:hypothetical protein